MQSFVLLIFSPIFLVFHNCRFIIIIALKLTLKLTLTLAYKLQTTKLDF